MSQQKDISNSGLTCMDCITGHTIRLKFEDGKLVMHNPDQSAFEENPQSASAARFESEAKPQSQEERLLIGPGLIDLQVNGVNAIDFNNSSLTVQQVKDATYWLLSQGVTSYLPTVITNSVENICTLVGVIYQACKEDSTVNECIHGIHLEGPFLSPEPGARGAHNKDYTRLPDRELFENFQKAAGGKISMVTLAPELPGSDMFIRYCRDNNILVSIGHSMAGAKDIDMAIRAGAGLCTHLGNAVPLMMPRHPNILWELIARDELYACIIADGIHVPDSFIKVVLKARKNTTLVVSDATCFAGMAPGEYQNHIGGAVVVDDQKRVSLKSEPGMLAGAGKTILENIETLIGRQLTDLGTAWSMCSANITEMFTRNQHPFAVKQDHVIFTEKGGRIKIRAVIKNGQLIYQYS